jgi:hypothetical protein
MFDIYNNEYRIGYWFVRKVGTLKLIPYRRCDKHTVALPCGTILVSKERAHYYNLCVSSEGQHMHHYYYHGVVMSPNGVVYKSFRNSRRSIGSCIIINNTRYWYAK